MPWILLRRPSPVEERFFFPLFKNCDGTGSGAVVWCWIVNSSADSGEGGLFDLVVLGDGVADTRREEALGLPVSMVSEPPLPCVKTVLSMAVDEPI
jgi:hypothetical protein